MKAFAMTDIGQMRESNQDSVYYSQEPVGILPNLFIVADGMGGHRAGDFASSFCVDEFVHTVKESRETTILSTIEKALRKTNEQLIQKAKERTELDGMGTTFVMATILDDVMYVANIGDSRLYLIDSDMKQITMDHSLVAEMVRNGDINEEAARFHPNKNIVTRALSTNAVVVPDFFEVPLDKGNMVLICSDGLFSMLENNEIMKVINENREDVEKACSILVEKANKNGGRDNISVVLINVA